MCCQDSTIGPPWISSSSLTLLEHLKIVNGHMWLHWCSVWIMYQFDMLMYVIHAVGASLHAPYTLLAELRWHTLQVGAKMSWSCVAKQTFPAQLAVCDKRRHPKPIWQRMPGLALSRFFEVCLLVRNSNYKARGGRKFHGENNCLKVAKAFAYIYNPLSRTTETAPPQNTSRGHFKCVVCELHLPRNSHRVKISKAANCYTKWHFKDFNDTFSVYFSFFSVVFLLLFLPAGFSSSCLFCYCIFRILVISPSPVNTPTFWNSVATNQSIPRVFARKTCKTYVGCRTFVYKSTASSLSLMDGWCQYETSGIDAWNRWPDIKLHLKV